MQISESIDPTVTEALRVWRMQHHAGIPIAQTFENCASLCDTPGPKNGFLEAGRRANRGASIEALLDALKPVLAQAEQAAVAAGWASGRFEPVMDGLIAQRETGAKVQSKIRSKMVLPLLMFGMAAFIAPIPRLALGGSVEAYVFSVLAPLLIVFALWKFAASILRVQAIHDTFVKLPLIQEIERQRNLADFASLVSLLIGAGMALPAALEKCAQASAHGAYRSELLRIAKSIVNGSTLAGGFQQGKLWPAEFTMAIATAEKSGALETTFARLGQNARDRHARALHTIADWLPRIIYALVVLMAIGQIALMVLTISSLYRTQ